MRSVPDVLPAPKIPASLGEDANWLAGEGAGSWFQIAHIDGIIFKISRYSSVGKLECEGFFVGENINLSEPYAFTYPSHCQRVSLLQDGRIKTLQKIEEQ